MQRFLQAARKSRRYTALDVAQGVGLSEGRLYRIEHGRTSPTDEERARLADFLGYSVDVLFPGHVQREEAR